MNEPVCQWCDGTRGKAHVHRSKTDAPDVVVCEPCSFVNGYGVAVALDKAGLMDWNGFGETQPLVIPAPPRVS